MPKYKITRRVEIIEVAYAEVDSMREVYELDEIAELNFQALRAPMWFSDISIEEVDEIPNSEEEN